MEKKKKKPPIKPYQSDNIRSVVEEPEATYTISPSHNMTLVYGNIKNKPTKSNYIKRSLELMGMMSVKPFNTVENVSDFIECIRAGVPKKALDNLIDVIGTNAVEMSGIIRVSDRTLRRYSSNQKLNAEQSERVIELAKIFSRGEEVFGSLDAFKRWMDSSVMALGNKKPKEFLDTSLGIEMLMDELGRIEHGIFA